MPVAETTASRLDCPLGVPMSLQKRQGLLVWARRSRAWVPEDHYPRQGRAAGAALGAERV